MLNLPKLILFLSFLFLIIGIVYVWTSDKIPVIRISLKSKKDFKGEQLIKIEGMEKICRKEKN